MGLDDGAGALLLAVPGPLGIVPQLARLKQQLLDLVFITVDQAVDDVMNLDLFGRLFP